MCVQVLPSEGVGNPSSTALVVGQCEALSPPQSAGADPVALQGDEANAECLKQEPPLSPVKPLGSTATKPVVNTSSTSFTDSEQVVHQNGDSEKSVANLSGKAATLTYLKGEAPDSQLNDSAGVAKGNSQGTEEGYSQGSDSTEKEKFLSDGAVGDESSGERISTPVAMSSPEFKEAVVDKASQSDTPIEHASKEDAFSGNDNGNVTSREAGMTSSDGSTSRHQDREEGLPVGSSSLKPFPVTMENSSDDDSDPWDESLLQPVVRHRNDLPFSSKQEQQSLERKQACFNAFMSEKNESTHFNSNPPFQQKRAVNRHHYRGGNRYQSRSRYELPHCRLQNTYPGQQQLSLGRKNLDQPPHVARGRGTLAR